MQDDPRRLLRHRESCHMRRSYVGRHTTSTHPWAMLLGRDKTVADGAAIWIRASSGDERDNLAGVADTGLTGERADHDSIGADSAQYGRGLGRVGYAGDDADSGRLEHLSEPASDEGPVPH